MAIPIELQERNQWVLWREEQRNGKPTKPPFDAKTGGLAAVDDPRTWSDYRTALEKAQSPHWSGVGFVVTKDDPYTFIDLDDPGENKELQDSHKELIAQFDSYTELSPSGRGVHIIVRGSVPSGKRSGPLEIYPHDRYMTVTGNNLNGGVIRDRQDLLLKLWRKLGGEYGLNKNIPGEYPDVETVDDARLYEQASKAKDGEKFLRLWNGDLSAYLKQGGGFDQSRADQALLNILAFYSDSKAQVIRMFQQSSLGSRTKARRQDYLDRSVALAFDQKVHPERVQELQELLRKNNEPVAFPVTLTHQLVPVPDKSTILDTLPEGRFKQTAQFIFDQSPYPIPEIAVCGAIGFFAGFCGRAWNIENLGLNQYTLLLAPTGAGKEAIATGISKLVGAVSERVPAIFGYYGANYIASGQALYNHLKKNPCILSVQDEFGVELRNLTDSFANNSTRMLKKAYLELFSKSGHGSVLGASIFANVEKNTEELRSPSLSLLCQSTPEDVWATLDESLIADGFLGRWSFVDVERAGEAFNYIHASVKVPEPLKEHLQQLVSMATIIEHENRVGPVSWTEGSHRMQEEFRASARKYVVHHQVNGLAQLWNRAHVKAIKLAALMAVAENGVTPVITESHFAWAAEFITKGITIVAKRFEMGNFGGADSKAVSDVLQFLKRYYTEDAASLPKSGLSVEMHKAGIISHSYLSKQVLSRASFRNGAGGSTNTFNRIAKHLQDNGNLSPMQTGEAMKWGTTGITYRIMKVDI